MRKCSNCKQLKEKSEFYVRKSGRVDSWCKECRRNDTKEWRKKNGHNSEYHKAYRLAHLEEIKAQKRRRKYGDFPYEEMLAEQQGRCAICGKATTLVIDHDHQTGEVRSLLCTNCNVGLGYFSDSPELLSSAAAYAAKWKKGGKKKKK
jgi:hypothetical protein